MLITMLKAKIHQATVTEANLYYIGSITIDEAILKVSNLNEYEKVDVVNINNGARISTYIIKGEINSGICCLNGAAARYFHKGDKIIIMSYALINEIDKDKLKPKIIFLNSNNKIVEISNSETSNTYLKYE